MNLGFADVHQHALWGMDDGPQTAEQMHALLRQSAQNGIGVIAATAHAYPRSSPFHRARYMERLEQARAYCRAEGLPLRIESGSEIRYCDTVPDLLAAGKLLTLGGTRHVLIEFDPDVSPEEIGEAANRLYQAGYHPIVAHVERCVHLMRAPDRAMRAREEYGLIYQMNCETLLRPRGWFERRFVRKMLESEAIDLLASDAHDVSRRPVRMKAAYDLACERCSGEYAGRLVRFGWSLLERKELEAT